MPEDKNNPPKTQVTYATGEQTEGFGGPPVDKTAELLKAKASAGGIDPEVLQLLMAVVAKSTETTARTIVQEMKKPTEAEQKKIDNEIEKQKRRALNAAAIGAQVAAIERAEQSRCGHSKPNGRHTWRGQAHSNGTVFVQCMRCHKPYFDLVATPDMLQSGVNLDEIQGLTEEHLRKWKENSPAIAAHFAQQVTKQFSPFAVKV